MAVGKLTLGVLNKLEFVTLMYLDGGDRFSVFQSYNEDYNLYLNEKTNGSPNYQYVERYISTADNSIELDLMLARDKIEKAKQDFIEEYNNRFFKS